MIKTLLFSEIFLYNFYAKLYIALAGAMLAGRLAAGLVNAFIFNAGRYSIEAWLTASFVTALPGVAIQLVLIPALCIALQKAKLFELRN